MSAVTDWTHEAPVPFADGLCFMSEDEDIQRSGLTTYICDVSTGVLCDIHGRVVDVTADMSTLAEDERPVKMVRTFDACAKSAAKAKRRLADPKGKAFLAETGDDVRGAFAAGRTAVVLQFQGCDPIESDLDRMPVFRELGVRILQIVHHGNNDFGGGCMEPTWRGLTDVGKAGVEQMNELGIIPDLAHAADPTSHNVLDISTQPVIISHTGPRAIVNNARCAPDDVIKRVADSGGMVGLFMMSFWVTSDPEPTVDAFVRSLEHLVNVAGEDHVGIANDFTLAGEASALAVDNDNSKAIVGYYPWWDMIAAQGIFGYEKRPTHVIFPELNNIERMWRIKEALEARGFSASRVEKIVGGNWVRVLADCLG